MTIITTKFKIGQIIYTPKGPGIIRFININVEEKTRKIEYEFEFLYRENEKIDPKYGFVLEHEAFKDAWSLIKYLNKHSPSSDPEKDVEKALYSYDEIEKIIEKNWISSWKYASIRNDRSVLENALDFGRWLDPTRI